jgi:succinate dehydrogenase / fumarate reductase cytochrome b subunit
MAAQQRPLSPHLSIYRQKLTGTLSILHRITGVFLAFGAFALAAWLVAASGDAEGYSGFMAIAASWPAQLFICATVAALMYHLLNGIRHLLWDMGWGLELPRAYATGWTVVVLSLLGTAVLCWLAYDARVLP